MITLGATVVDGRVALVAAVNDRCRELGLTANAVLQSALPAIGGRGGGKDDIAQGGGTDVAGLEQSFRDVAVAVESFSQA